MLDPALLSPHLHLHQQTLDITQAVLVDLVNGLPCLAIRACPGANSQFHCRRFLGGMPVIGQFQKPDELLLGRGLRIAQVQNHILCSPRPPIAEYPLQQLVAIAEVVIKAAARNAHGLRQRIDTYSVDPAFAQQLLGRLNPVLTGQIGTRCHTRKP